MVVDAGHAEVTLSGAQKVVARPNLEYIWLLNHYVLSLLRRLDAEDGVRVSISVSHQVFLQGHLNGSFFVGSVKKLTARAANTRAFFVEIEANLGLVQSLMVDDHGLRLRHDILSLALNDSRCSRLPHLRLVLKSYVIFFGRAHLFLLFDLLLLKLKCF